MKYLLILICLFGSLSQAEALSGSVNWQGWTFQFSTTGHYAGLELRAVRFNGDLILYKGSMPSIRVRYDGDACGPYSDRIGDSNIVDAICSGNGQVGKVCSYAFTRNGKRWYELGIYSRLGKYHLYHAWYFSEDGRLQGRLWSKGLHCVYDHEHHAYWRMDFDVDGAGNDQAFVHGSNRGNTGWGNGWFKLTSELNMVKQNGTNDLWFVRDNSTTNGVWVMPAPYAGQVNSFGSKDIGVRRYRGSEDVGWAFGAWGHLGYDNGENIEEKDNVFWYVGHIYHHADEGENQWEWVGPTFIHHKAGGAT